MKTKTPYVRLLLLLFFFTSFLFAGFTSLNAQILVNTSFEGANPFNGFSTGQACCSYSVTASTAKVHDGTQSFRAEVRQGDPAISSGYRAEIRPNSLDDQGDMWYGYSTLFEKMGGDGGHCIQWHPNNGTGSATLSIWTGENTFNVVRTLGIGGANYYQSSGGAWPIKAIVLNKWYDIVFHVKWSTGADGIIEIWLDGQKYYEYRGQNQPPEGVYIKFGMNRWNVQNDWLVYYDNLKIGRDVTYNDVAPATTTVPANQAPVARAGNDINISLPTILASLDGSASSDPDGSITNYSWSRVSGPTGFSLLNPLSVITTVTSLLQGTYVFRLTVTDNKGATSTDDVTVNVAGLLNQSPAASAGNDINLTLPTSSVTLSGSGTDPDGSISTYAWTRVSGPTTFTLANANAATTTLSNLVQGTYVFRLTVTDNKGATATDNINVVVNAAPNQAPAASAGNDISITLPANSATLVGSGSDPDGTIASYAWSRVSGPTTYTLGNANAASTGLTGLVQGAYVFRLTVTDNNGATATDNISVTVNAAPNQAPTANAGNDISITLPVNTTTLTGSGTDADGNIASYAWARVSGPTTFSLGNANAASSALTGLVQGTYVFSLTVTDNNGATATDNISVTVNAALPNQAPTVNAGNDISITLPSNAATLTGTGTDADGTIASYAWTRVSGPTTFSLGNANAASSALTGLVQGTYVFSLTVTDNSGATATDNISVTVNAAPNQAPAADAGNAITITLPTNSTTLSGTGTDVDGTIASYAWSRVSGPTTFSLSNANAAATALTSLEEGVYVFRLTVTDNNGATATDNITVTVNAATAPANQVPNVNAGTDIVITLPTNNANLAGAAVDADGTIASYAWTRVSGPTTFTFASATAATTAVTGLVQGTYVFRLTVTDNAGATATDNISVTVNAAPNQAPIARAGNDIAMTLPTNATTLNGSGSTDPDGTILTYAWAYVSGPVTYTIGNVNIASTTLNGLVQGTYVFRLTVTDNNGVTATDNVSITVNAAVAPPNQAPVVNAGNDITITLPNSTANLNGSAIDADGTIATYAWSRVSGPTTFTIANAGAASTSLTNLVQGVYVFRLTVTDNSGATATDNVTITVNAALPVPNQAPGVNAGTDITITLPTSTANLNGSAVDADGTIATYAWSRVSGPTTFTIGNAGTASTTLTGLVQGVYVFRLTVTDDKGATATDNVTVTVNPAVAIPNQAPGVNAGNDITITLPANSANLNGSANDPDGTIASYWWGRVSGPTTFTITSPSAASTTLTGLVQGVYIFRLTVTDNKGATASNDVTVTVNPAATIPNQTPGVNAGNDITMTLPANTANLSGIAVDADGTIASYWWGRISGPTAFAIGNASAASTPLTNLVQGVYIFRLTVTDNKGAIATDDITVTVSAPPPPPPHTNEAPVARAGNDAEVTLPSSAIALNAIASTDPDGRIVSYEWTVLSAPTPATITDPLASEAQINGLTMGEYVVQLKVTDNNGASSTDTVKVMVKTINGDNLFLNIYPNPATDKLTLQYFEPFTGAIKITIYDAKNTLVKQEKMSKDVVSMTKEIDISTLRPGFYIIQIIKPDLRQVVRKFVKR